MVMVMVIVIVIIRNSNSSNSSNSSSNSLLAALEAHGEELAHSLGLGQLSQGRLTADKDNKLMAV